MKQVVGCLITPEIADVVVAELSVRGDVNAVIKSDTQEAIQLAQLAGEVDVFIVEDGPDKNNFKKVASKIKEKATVIGIGDPDSPDAPEICYRPEDWAKLGEHVKKILGSESEVSGQYISMPINLFLHFEELNVDVFLRMTKDGRPHWVRRFLAGEPLEAQEVSAYRAKGVEEFWLEKEKIKEFSKKLLERLNTRARNSLSKGIESVKEAEEVFKSMSEITQKMGVKGQMVTICEGWMQELAQGCMETNNEDVRGWWERLTQDPSLSFQYRLVRLTSLLCTQHIMLTDWTSKEEQAQKLAGVALFADMELTDPAWIHLRTPESLSALDADKKLMVAGHAAFAARKLQSVPFVTKDIAILVAQHHGHQQGDWLPDRVSASVSPLALVYIACEELAYHSLMRPEVPIKDIYHELLAKFKVTAVRKPLEQMPAIFGW